MQLLDGYLSDAGVSVRSTTPVCGLGHCIEVSAIYSYLRFLFFHRNSYNSNNAQVLTGVVVALFVFVALAFFVYDRYVQQRNDKIVKAAARSNAIVASLFPSNVRDRLFANEDDKKEKKKGWLSPKSNLKEFLEDENADEEDPNNIYGGKPIADLFPETTILFADLVGFTAWSSTREPAQVFTLLETVYRAFDVLAKKRRVFKVETVGDCYVAVTGLPEPRRDHAVAMARFANEILHKIHELTKKMEVTLGPDTADLTVRVGLHSGPVTAGVLRGDRSRFQLFGDTMNTAARMESTGTRDKIQISQETADLLISAGKTQWVKEREDVVVAKGKGALKTFWLDIQKHAGDASSRAGTSDCSSSVANDIEEDDHVQKLVDERTRRLIDWNVDLLLKVLRQIVARRRISSDDDVKVDTLESEEGRTPMDDVKEVIEMAEFDAKVAKAQEDADSIELDDEVVEQMHDFVTNIAAL